MAATNLSPSIPSNFQMLANLYTIKKGFHHTLPTTSSKRGISLVRASSKPQTPLISQEDLSYLVKLGGGSIAGAAAIKYGSIIYPEITQPNLAQALFMIFAPVVVAVLLLINQSRITEETNRE